MCVCVTGGLTNNTHPVTRVAGHARVQCGCAPSGPGTLGLSPIIHGTWLHVALVIHDYVLELEEALGLERFGEKVCQVLVCANEGHN